tara:strand:+ start:1507 stop:1941 length:435 start_codon:yes stop_codon:yes gene_type:complete
MSTEKLFVPSDARQPCEFRGGAATPKPGIKVAGLPSSFSRRHHCLNGLGGDFLLFSAIGFGGFIAPAVTPTPASAAATGFAAGSVIPALAAAMAPAVTSAVLAVTKHMHGDHSAPKQHPYPVVEQPLHVVKPLFACVGDVWPVP